MNVRRFTRSPRRRGRAAGAARLAKRFGGLEVNDERVFVRLLNWQVAGFGSFKDAIDVSCRLPILLERGDGDAVRHQTANPGELGVPGYGWQAIPIGQFEDLLLGQGGEGIGWEDQTTVRLVRKTRDRWLDVGGAANLDGDRPHAAS